MGFNTTKRAVAQGWSKRHMAHGLHRRFFAKAVGVRASLVVNPAGTNNGITYRAVHAGAAGNSLRIRHVVSGANTPLSVSIAGNDVTVNVATNGSSAATSTARQVVDAVNGSKAITALMAAEVSEGDGTGVVAAQAFTNLAGGVG